MSGGEKKKELKSKYYPKFLKELPEQKGKVVVITGTTSGTGNVAAKATLTKGAVAVMLNRNEEKARKSMETFFEEHPEAVERSVFVRCDLQNFESVEKAAEEVKQQFADSGIDVLCNNAGIMAFPDKATGDGYDVQMQTNHLSHFLLTKEFFPLLVKAAEEKGEARVVNHSSMARMITPTPIRAKFLEKKGGKLGGNGVGKWERYHQSKLANAVFTTEMQKRCDAAGYKISCFAAHPGLSATQLAANGDVAGGEDLEESRFVQTAEDGSMGILKGMFSNKVTKGLLYGPRFTTGEATHRWYGIPWFFSSGNTLWTKSEEACGKFEIKKKE